MLTRQQCTSKAPCIHVSMLPQLLLASSTPYLYPPRCSACNPPPYLHPAIPLHRLHLLRGFRTSYLHLFQSLSLKRIQRSRDHISIHPCLLTCSSLSRQQSANTSVHPYLHVTTTTTAHLQMFRAPYLFPLCLVAPVCTIFFTSPSLHWSA